MAILYRFLFSNRTDMNRLFAAGTRPGPQGQWAEHRLLLVYLVGIVALWTLACGLTHTAPDKDGMEELVWASSLEWGYIKHPPLPSWIMHGLVAVFGRPVWLSFFAGQVFAALGLLFVYLLGCEITSARRALIATLMVSVTVYFSQRGTIFNHNTVQLWSIAASSWLLLRALRQDRMMPWLWFGLTCGLAMMTKYSAVVEFTAFFLFLLVRGHLRRASVWRGALAAGAVAVLVFSPHLIWLFHHHFAPLYYADHMMAASGYWQAVADIVMFSLDQLARLSPMLVLWIALWWWQRRHADETLHTAQTPTYVQALSAESRSFLLWVGLSPFLLTVGVALVGGIHLQASWATTFFVLYGFYSFWRLKGDDRVWLHRTLVVAVVIQVLFAVDYGLGRGPLAWVAGANARSTYPGAQIAAQVNQAWQTHVPHVPLRLVASDMWMGGNIAVHTDPKTQVFIGASYAESPWLDPDHALDCGALVAFSPDTGGAWTPGLINLYQKAPIKGSFTQLWSSPRSPTFTVKWGIIPPSANCPLQKK